MPKSKNDIEELSFEDAMSELEQIIDNLEQGDITLDQSIEGWSRAMALKNHCEKKLEHARLKVDKLLKDSSDQLSLNTFDDHV